MITWDPFRTCKQSSFEPRLAADSSPQYWGSLSDPWLTSLKIWHFTFRMNIHDSNRNVAFLQRESLFQRVNNGKFQFYKRFPGRCGRNAKCEVKVKTQMVRYIIRTSISNDDWVNVFIILNPLTSRNSASLLYLVQGAVRVKKWLKPFRLIQLFFLKPSSILCLRSIDFKLKHFKSIFHISSINIRLSERKVFRAYLELSSWTRNGGYITRNFNLVLVG
jgi:hypothetical protein